MRSKLTMLVLLIALLLLHVPSESRQIKERKLENFIPLNCECAIIFYEPLDMEELGRVYKCKDGSIHLIYYTEEGLQQIKDEINRTLERQ